MPCSCAHPSVDLPCTWACSSPEVAAYTPVVMPWREIPGNITHWPPWSPHYTLLLGNRAFGISSVHTGRCKGPVCPSCFPAQAGFSSWAALWSCDSDASELTSPATTHPVTISGSPYHFSVGATVREVWGTDSALSSEVLPLPRLLLWQRAMRSCHTRHPSICWSWKLWEGCDSGSCLFSVPWGITSLFSPLSKTMRNGGSLIH